MVYINKERSNTPLTICASERQGNSLVASKIISSAFAKTLQTEKHAESSPLLLNRFNIATCIDCGLCALSRPDLSKVPSCPQGAKDDSSELFDRLLKAPALALVSPIYFYHLPARLKALIDRCQYYYNQPKLQPQPLRKAFVILLAGRPKGEQLFAGSLLSLKYGLLALGYELAPPLLLRGLDLPDDLKKNIEQLEFVENYAQEAAAKFSF